MYIIRTGRGFMLKYRASEVYCVIKKNNTIRLFTFIQNTYSMLNKYI